MGNIMLLKKTLKHSIIATMDVDSPLAATMFSHKEPHILSSNTNSGNSGTKRPIEVIQVAQLKDGSLVVEFCYLPEE